MLILALLLTQTPPATEVYLAGLSRDPVPHVAATVVNVSENAGYDNQPSFTPDGRAVLFTSNRDGKQTDIYRYDLATGALTQLTHTTESEYSPIVTPDGRTFSVIRVEADGTQRLWRFDLDGSNPRLVLENVKPVGYHVWIDASHLGLFVLGAGREPATLQLADTTTGMADVIDSSIGRSLLMRPGTTSMSYVSKPQGAAWSVKLLDPKTRVTTTLTETMPNSEDCAWDPSSGMLLMASGAKIYGWAPGRSGWTELGDLTSAGIGRITRLAVNPDPNADPSRRLAIVAEPMRR
jgi:dipeptidyl aminopeptidase/acylaminoacyl peptidase